MPDTDPLKTSLGHMIREFLDDRQTAAGELDAQRLDAVTRRFYAARVMTHPEWKTWDASERNFALNKLGMGFAANARAAGVPARDVAREVRLESPPPPRKPGEPAPPPGGYFADTASDAYVAPWDDPLAVAITAAVPHLIGPMLAGNPLTRQALINGLRSAVGWMSGGLTELPAAMRGVLRLGQGAARLGGRIGTTAPQLPAGSRVVGPAEGVLEKQLESAGKAVLNPEWKRAEIDMTKPWKGGVTPVE